MAEIFGWLISHAGWPWVIGASLLIVALNQTGFVQRFFAEKKVERASEREQLSEDTQELIHSLMTAAERDREYRVSDGRYYNEEIHRLRELLAARDLTIGNLSETVVKSERGNARLRHALNHSFQYIQSLRDQARREGKTSVPFNGWKDLLGLAPDLDQYLQDLFGKDTD